MNDESPAEPASSIVTTVSLDTCPKCGQPAAGSALGGLCERCLVRVGLGIGADGDSDHGPHDVASIFDDLDAENDKLPREFGDYELLEEIGIGGMGVIYKAKHLNLGRIVALKMIKAGELARREDVRRFKAEAEAAARLRHPNVVTIHDIGEEDGLPYFSMSYVGGPNLGQLVRMQPLSSRRAATMMRKIALAVQHAHDEGLLHRDIKPGNILIDTSDEPQVTDFGLARAIHSDSSLTRSGAILGSPSYMSPEQAEGRMKDVDVRTDIYALGAVLYEMVTGRPPFQGESAMHTLRLVCQAEPAAPRLLNPDVPPDLETICLRCLEKQPARRYSTAREVAQELEAFLAGKPIKSRKVGPAGRLLRWCRRQPELAALTGALVIALTGGLIGMALGWGEARRNAADEQIARHAAEAGERRANLGVYNADMMLANVAMRDGDRARLIELLDRHDPALHPGAPDLRSWEWFFLKAQTGGEELFTLGKHDSPVTAMDLSPDGRWAASVDRAGLVRFWDMEKRGPAAEFPSGTGGDVQIGFSPDGRWLATGWDSGQSFLWRTGRWQQPAQSWTRSASRNFVFSPDSRSLYQVGRGTAIHYPLPAADEPPGPARTLFDMPEKWNVLPLFEPGTEKVVTFTGALEVWDGSRQEFTGETWKPDNDEAFITLLKRDLTGRRLAGWFNDECVYVLDRQTLRPVHRLRGHRGAVFAAAFSPDGSLLATGGGDQSVQVWNLDTGDRVRRLGGHRDAVTAVAFFPDGERVLSGSRDGSLRAWSSRPPPPPEGRIRRRTPHGLLSPDGRLLVELIRDTARPEAVIRSVLTDTTIASFDGSTVRDVAIGPAGRFFSLLHNDGTMEFLQQEGTGYRPVHRLATAATGRDDGIILSSDGGTLVLFIRNEAIVYDAATSAERTRLSWPESRGRIYAAVFSPGARRLALASADGAISLFNLESGQEECVLTPGDGRHPGLAFSPDGRWLATAAFDGGARVWDVSQSPPVLRLTTTAHDSSWSVNFTPDSRRLVVGLDSGDITFWDLAAGVPVMVFRNQSIPATRTVFDPDGHTLTSISSNQVIRRPIAPGYHPAR